MAFQSLPFLPDFGLEPFLGCFLLGRVAGAAIEESSTREPVIIGIALGLAGLAGVDGLSLLFADRQGVVAGWCRGKISVRVQSICCLIVLH